MEIDKFENYHERATESKDDILGKLAILEGNVD